MGEVDQPHRGILNHLNFEKTVLSYMCISSTAIRSVSLDLYSPFMSHMVSEINLSVFVPADKIPNNSMRIVMESDSRKRPAPSHDGGLPTKKPWFDK